MKYLLAILIFCLPAWATVGDLAVDPYCQTQGVYDASCITNAIAALPSAGGVLRLSDNTYDFGTGLTISRSYVRLLGTNMGSTVSGGTRIIGTGSPLIFIQGMSASSRTVLVSLEQLSIAPTLITANQICLEVDHATDIQLRNVQFNNCSQAEWGNDYFFFDHSRVFWNNSGTGNTNTGATVRLENVSNPATPSEQAHFDNCNWSGDQHTFINQGIGLYVGPGAQETYLENSKMDYTNSRMNSRVVVLYQTNTVHLLNNTITSGSLANPPTASSVIDISGPSVSNRTNRVEIIGGRISGWTSTYAINVDYGQAVAITGNTYSGSGSGTFLNFTANAYGVRGTGLVAYTSGDVPVRNLCSTCVVGDSF